MGAIENYYAALERLKAHQPLKLKKGEYKLNQDAVCLEAGVKRGSIKPGRSPAYAQLVADIKQAAEAFKPPLSKQQLAEKRAKDNRKSAEEYRDKWQAALNREAQLVRYVRHLEQRLMELDPQVVTELHPSPAQKSNDVEIT